MSGTFMSLLVLEAGLTAAAVLMFLYRGMLDMKEEDHIILSAQGADGAEHPIDVGMRGEHREEMTAYKPGCAGDRDGMHPHTLTAWPIRLNLESPKSPTSRRFPRPRQRQYNSNTCNSNHRGNITISLSTRGASLRDGPRSAPCAGPRPAAPPPGARGRGRRGRRTPSARQRAGDPPARR